MEKTDISYELFKYTATKIGINNNKNIYNIFIKYYIK